MGISAIWLMSAGHGLTFTVDEVYYYGRYVDHSGLAAPANGLEYFLAPHNGHLVVLGKLIYRALFLTVGTDYTAFRAVEVAVVILSVGLFFVLARRRVGPLAALIASVLLLFLGYAYETLLWPFNLHTVLALVFGLTALLMLERGDRRGDWTACALLVASIATVELGLAFAGGIAVSILLRPDRRNRVWIFLVPIALYALWWFWAQRFHQPSIDLVNVHLIPIGITNALAAVVGSVFGLNPTGEGVSVYVTTVTAWGSALAAFAVVGLVLRVRRGSVPDSLWVSLAVILVYWVMIAMGARPPDSSRYIFVGVMMVLLVAADALRGMRLGGPALIGAACVVALAIPPNIAKLYDGRAPRLVDAVNTRTEYAMLELAGHRAAPDYTPALDSKVIEAGGGVITGLPAADYLRSANDFGSLAFPLDRVRAESLTVRQVADTTLVDALGIQLRQARPPTEPGDCASSLEGRPGHSVFFPIPQAKILLGSRSEQTLQVAISRFGTGGSGVSLGQLDAGDWASLSVPHDSAPDRWRLVVDGPVYVCASRRG